MHIYRYRSVILSVSNAHASFSALYIHLQKGTTNQRSCVSDSRQPKASRTVLWSRGGKTYLHQAQNPRSLSCLLQVLNWRLASQAKMFAAGLAERFVLAQICWAWVLKISPGESSFLHTLQSSDNLRPKLPYIFGITSSCLLHSKISMAQSSKLEDVSFSL